METKEEETFNSEELLEQLRLLILDKKFKKPNPLPKFNIQEARFIRDLIFWKPKGVMFYYLADYMMNETVAKYMPMFNAPSLKKLHFILNLLSLRGSAKDAAIKAGYSPKTAKQQASRALRQIRGYKRWE